jgi:hypothetical protein
MITISDIQYDYKFPDPLNVSVHTGGWPSCFTSDTLWENVAEIKGAKDAKKKT